VERPAEAIEIFTRAVAAGRATASDRYRFARLLIEQGQPEAAEAELDAIIAGPAFPEVEAARSARAELSASDEG
jgi:Tetratricopeptide repeat